VTGLDVTPLEELRLRTPRLELRLPDEDELAALAAIAASGIHDADAMPFAEAWTDGVGEPGWAEGFAAYHRGARAAIRPDDWALVLAVFHDAAPIGVQELNAREFAARRTVGSGSWLGRPFQGRRFGTEMRGAVLDLAFRGLGATAAESGALAGNVASARVSERLGYVPAGESTASPRGDPVRVQRYRIERATWLAAGRAPASISGLEACLPLLVG